jgi:hypothetical protein
MSLCFIGICGDIGATGTLFTILYFLVLLSDMNGKTGLNKAITVLWRHYAELSSMKKSFDLFLR